MRIFIFVDMEGISGVSGSDHVMTDGRLYQDARRYYTWDTNACIRACFDAGAEGVIVRDGHSSGNHMITSELDPRAELIQGQTQRRLPGIEECDALILLGYHAMAGTAGALLEHTFSSKTVQNYWLNGRKVGEIGIDAGVASDHGKPTIMVSGDDKACAEAEDWIPGVVACVTKTGMMCQGARMLSLDTAHKLIEEKTREAIGRIGDIKPMPIERPVTYRKEMVERCGIPNGFARPDIRVIDARTVETTADTVEEAFYRI
jgi:D-amino peptidase